MNTFNYSFTHQQTSPRSKLLDQRATTFHQKHTLNDYGLLNKVISQQSKKTKKKKFRKPSLQVYSDHEHHCQSLDKLKFLHQQKNHQIRNYIYQKAALQAQNEQLKLKLLNPSVRQNELHNIIHQIQVQMSSLSQQMQEQQEKHIRQIKQLKAKHQSQLNAVRQSYSRSQATFKPSSVRYYEPYKVSQRQISPPKQVIRTYQNDKRLIIENSRDMSPKQYIKFPENAQKNSRTIQYMTSQSSSYQNRIQAGPKANFLSTSSMGCQKVFINPQSTVQPPIYSMNPSFARQNDSPKKYTANTSKNTTHTYNQNKNQAVNRVELNNLPQTTNQLTQRQISPQYRNNVYVYQKVHDGAKEVVNKGKTVGYQAIKSQNSNNKQTISNTITRQAIQGNKTGVSDRQIDDIYKRYYLNDK